MFLQSSNKVIECSLQNAEKTVWTVVDLSIPIVTKFEDPINKIDDLMCKSLDLVEQNAPIVTYTPEEVKRLCLKRFIELKTKVGLSIQKTYICIK